MFNEKTQSKMFEFTLKMFIWLVSVLTTRSFCESLAFNSKGHIKCVYLNNRPCQARTTLDINFNETLFYPLTVSVNKCGGSCNTINDSYI